MSLHWSESFPRNTSNGDYGRFLFAPGNGERQSQQNSSNGNRMMPQVHYPNCPNKHRDAGASFQQFGNPNQGQGSQEGMQEYTVEYGEDAVRAALGGELPDFQSQFQKQYGSGDGGDGDGFKISPEQVQMTDEGKSKIAMLPVVLTTEDKDDKVVKEEDLQAPEPAEAPVAENDGIEPVEMQKASGQRGELLKNVMDSIRRSKSSGPVNCGRHIRPSYWNPQVPNPCRKKLEPGSVGADGNQCSETTPSNPQANLSEVPTSPMYNYPPLNGVSNGCTTQPTLSKRTDRVNRARSLPQKKPSVSLCGKCQKCRNLNPETRQTSVLALPKIANGQRRIQKLNTSSNIGQSAKNFRAISFPSSHQNYI